MKLSAKTFRNLATVLLLTNLAGLSPLAAAPPAPPAVTNTPAMSVFTMPTSAKEGRDPFFPTSMRPYQEAAADNPNQGPDYSAIKLGGISRTSRNVLCIINGETFAKDDEAFVKTPTGKIHVRCIQIDSSSVIIDAAGQIITLKLANP
jgi:hypothetical protein